MTKKTISKMSTRLLALEFKSGNIVKSKAMKFIAKKILPDYKENNFIISLCRNGQTIRIF